jgi:hypothetical protein
MLLWHLGLFRARREFARREVRSMVLPRTSTGKGNPTFEHDLRLPFHQATIESYSHSIRIQMFVTAALFLVKYTGVADLQVGDDEACAGPFRAGLHRDW